MIRNTTELSSLILAIRPGQYDIINNRVVTREGDYFLIEGTKNRKFAWNVAAERLAKVRGQ